MIVQIHPKKTGPEDLRRLRSLNLTCVRTADVVNLSSLSHSLEKFTSIFFLIIIENRAIVWKFTVTYHKQQTIIVTEWQKMKI